MGDQAELLRVKLKQQELKKRTRTIAVISGKGGVGKSNFSLNFAMSLANKGHAVLLFDMDIGMGNIDILLGLSSTYSIADFFAESSISLRDMIMEIPGGIHYISGGTGLSHFPAINKQSFHTFSEQFGQLLEGYEYVIFDMAAGLNETSLKFVLSVDEILVITTPEPTSITDAYSAMKYITLANSSIPFYIVVNRSFSDQEGITTYNRISSVLERFLEKKVLLLGILPDDVNVQKAVRKQIPFIQYNEKSASSKALYEITTRFCQRDFNHLPSANKKHFVAKLKRFLFER